MTSKPEAPLDERAKDFTCRAGHCASPAACGFDGPCLAGLPPLPERRALPVIGSGIAGHARGYIADQMCEYARAALASPSLPLPGAQWSETAAIHAAHAAGFAGESWFMGPEELAHLLTLAHPPGQQEQAVLSDPSDEQIVKEMAEELDCVIRAYDGGTPAQFGEAQVKFDNKLRALLARKPRAREHIPSSSCWCEPSLEHKEGGAAVWVHREIQ